ncbi:MAG: hypothetical protein NZ954_01740 [Thermofilaceae archaeon]|nr:hypothetical protein [Thermofilaceae archaeon]MCX8180410.1 hypothetical protein [Thermofilaceae archaeon]MDW8003393.1 hypothetical protein [Thermofilaceae archaeon]
MKNEHVERIRVSQLVPRGSSVYINSPREKHLTLCNEVLQEG